MLNDKSIPTETAAEFKIVWVQMSQKARLFKFMKEITIVGYMVVKII
jgi:hypothetical protein